MNAKDNINKDMDKEVVLNNTKAKNNTNLLKGILLTTMKITKRENNNMNNTKCMSTEVILVKNQYNIID